MFPLRDLAVSKLLNRHCCVTLSYGLAMFRITSQDSWLFCPNCSACLVEVNGEFTTNDLVAAIQAD